MIPAPAPSVIPESLRLPFTFDAEGLRKDLSGFMGGEYVAHYNIHHYEGDWSALALRAVGGEAGNIFPDPSKSPEFADTPLLARCPHVQGVMRSFRCPLLAVRFLRLKAGSVIREHRDYELGFDDGEVRLHVPVLTNPDVEFVLHGKRVIMDEGTCWYVNVNFPHRVANRGTDDRVHLVMDCVVDDWLRGIMLDAAAGQS